MFQFLIGVAGAAVSMAGVLLTVPVASWIETSPAGQGVANALFSWIVLLTYATIHAPEVAYFYGMRAARAKPTGAALTASSGG